MGGNGESDRRGMRLCNFLIRINDGYWRRDHDGTFVFCHGHCRTPGQCSGPGTGAAASARPDLSLRQETNRVEGVETVYRGDVRQRAHLIPIFEEAKAEDLVVIHCAGIVSIQSRFSQEMADVNVGGTKNVVDLCAEYAAHRLVYISSVHAIPEGPPGQLIAETNEFDPAAVEGHYAKSKAEAMPRPASWQPGIGDCPST